MGENLWLFMAKLERACLSSYASVRKNIVISILSIFLVIHGGVSIVLTSNTKYQGSNLNSNKIYNSSLFYL